MGLSLGNLRLAELVQDFPIHIVIGIILRMDELTPQDQFIYLILSSCGKRRKGELALLTVLTIGSVSSMPL